MGTTLHKCCTALTARPSNPPQRLLCSVHQSVCCRAVCSWLQAAERHIAACANTSAKPKFLKAGSEWLGWLFPCRPAPCTPRFMFLHKVSAAQLVRAYGRSVSHAEVAHRRLSSQLAIAAVMKFALKFFLNVCCVLCAVQLEGPGKGPLRARLCPYIQHASERCSSTTV